LQLLSFIGSIGIGATVAGLYITLRNPFALRSNLVIAAYVTGIILSIAALALWLMLTIERRALIGHVLGAAKSLEENMAIRGTVEQKDLQELQDYRQIFFAIGDVTHAKSLEAEIRGAIEKDLKDSSKQSFGQGS
jgi:hypothetical protein